MLPHERTHRGPKEGRLRLLQARPRAARADLSPVRGPGAVRAAGRGPDLEVEGNRLWRIRDDGVSDWFADRSLLIADGHHRYETTLAYAEEGGSPWMLIVLVSAEDPGLEIFPTHRLVQELNGTELPPPTGEPRALLEFLEDEPRSRSVAVAYRPEGAGFLYGDEGELDVELVARHASEATYTASADEAIAAVDEGRAQAAFLLRPLRVDDVFAKAQRGETMPQKSTYFYPKLLSGLLFLSGVTVDWLEICRQAVGDLRGVLEELPTRDARADNGARRRWRRHDRDRRGGGSGHRAAPRRRA